MLKTCDPYCKLEVVILLLKLCMCAYTHAYVCIELILCSTGLWKKTLIEHFKKNIFRVCVALCRILSCLPNWFLRLAGEYSSSQHCDLVPCGTIWMELSLADLRNRLLKQERKKTRTNKQLEVMALLTLFLDWVFSYQGRTLFLLTCWSKISDLTQWNLPVLHGQTWCTCGKWCVLVKRHGETANQQVTQE